MILTPQAIEQLGKTKLNYLASIGFLTNEAGRWVLNTSLFAQNINKVDVSINKYDEIINHLNTKAGTKFRVPNATKRLINGRMKEGYTVDDFKRVIDFKTSEWLNNPEMKQYLRPATLFAPTKFEGYLNGAPPLKVDAPVQTISNEVKQDYGVLEDW